MGIASGLQVFTDLVNALEKVAGYAHDLINLPEKERNRYRKVIDESFFVLNSALNAVSGRLTELLLVTDRKEFVKSLSAVNDFAPWREVVRQMYVSQAMRKLGREIDGLGDRFIGPKSLKDWKTFKTLMSDNITLEHNLADSITASFSQLADLGSKAQATGAMYAYKKARGAVEDYRDELLKKRQQLLRDEVEFMNVV